jgi:hypothetical protein
VELYARVRRAVVVDKMSEREAAKQFVAIPTKEITYSDPKSIKIGVREAGLLHIDRLIDMSQR